MADHLARNLAHLVDLALRERTQVQLAESLGVSQPTISKWRNPHRKTDGKRLPEPEFRGVARLAHLCGLRVTTADLMERDLRHELADLPSQPAGLSTAMLGVALTSMDKVIRGRGLRMEGALGTFAPVLAFAYGAAQLEFPDGPPSPDTRPGRAALKAFDKKVDDYLGGMITDGAVEQPAGTGEEGAGKGQAEGTKAARGRRR